MFEQRQMQIARISAISIVSLVLAFTAGCSRDPNVRKQKYLDSGKRYEAAGKYKEASIQFLNAIKLDKNFADAHLELAKTDLKMGSVQGAYGELMRTVDLAPTNVEARIALGNIQLAGRRTDLAETQAKAVLAINPNYADAYALLAGVAQRKGDNAEARNDIQRAIAIDPNRPGYHSAMAMLEANTPADEIKAEQELQKAASLDPKSATPHLMLAQLLERKNDLQGAEQQLLAAINAAPTNLQAREALASLYVHLGDKAKAEMTLRKAIEDLPEDESASAVLGKYYAETGQMDHAETVFADLNSKYPKSLGIKITYARILFDRKDFAKATTVINQLSKADAGNTEVLTLNALLLMNTGKIDDALSLLKKSVKDNPNSAPTQLLLARVESAKGDFVGAESSYREADRLNPSNLEAANGLAEIAMRRNDAGTLSEIAEKTLKSHPDYSPAYLWRGTAEASRKEFDKAEADYQTVLKSDPNNATAYVELAQIRLEQGHFPEADALAEKTLEKDPNSTSALTLLVRDDYRAKQPAKAIARVKAQIAKSPTNGGFLTLLANLQLDQKDFKGALDSSHKAMQINPANPEAAETYASAAVGLGDVDSAISVWKGWTSSHPADPNGMQILGTLEEAKGDDVAAMDDYKKTLQLDPNNAIASNNLAYLMVENDENVDVALALAQTARRIWPDRAETADTLAWVYYHKENYTAARDLLESAVKTFPDNASVHLHLGMTYSKLNDKPDAQIHLKKAVALSPNTKVGKDAGAELAKL